MRFLYLAFAVFADLLVALPANDVLTAVESRQCPGDIKCSLAGSADVCTSPCMKCGFEGGWVGLFLFGC
jgi:hypothetical protein